MSDRENTSSASDPQHENKGLPSPQRDPLRWGEWGSVSAENPCPICNKPDWCRRTQDGKVVLCRRVEDGCTKVITDKSGGTFYKHEFPDGQPDWDVSKYQSSHATRTGCASPDRLHVAYATLLLELELSEQHWQDLKDRGYSEKLIDRRGFRTLPKGDRTALAARVKKKLRANLHSYGVTVFKEENMEELLLKVPGFYHKEVEGKKILTVGGKSGLLIPVFDESLFLPDPKRKPPLQEPRIRALKVRSDDENSSARYTYLSSTKHGGPSSGSPIHFPDSPRALCNIHKEGIRITEGEFKADLATLKTGIYTIGLPGVGMWRSLLSLLYPYDKDAFPTIRLAFDADAGQNPVVATALKDLAIQLQIEGYKVAMDTWDPADGKGIDEVLAEGKPIKTVRGDDLLAALTEIVHSAGINEPGTSKGESMSKTTGTVGSGSATLTSGGKSRKPSVADDLVTLVHGAGCELWHDPDKEAYVTLPGSSHFENMAINSKSFKLWLGHQYYNLIGRAPGTNSLADAINTLCGYARYTGPEHKVYTRLAVHKGRIYLDLGEPEWKAVEISKKGWKVIPTPPVKFIRNRGNRPLPEPLRGGDLTDLKPFLNVKSEAHWRLLVAWLLSAFHPQSPYPILALSGEQGSAKSTMSKLIRNMIDPNSAPLRSPPRKEQDLDLMAKNSYVVALNNLSYIPDWLADALCRLATEGGSSTRMLYENDQEIIFEDRRPVILNGIEYLPERSDLLDRCLMVILPAIGDMKRRTESELNKSFKRAYPQILGALLDIVVAGLKNLPKIITEQEEKKKRGESRLPRMADFAMWILACEPALGWDPESFLDIYTGNIREANEICLNENILYHPLCHLMVERKHCEWEGTPTDLLSELRRLADDHDEKLTTSKDWPKNANKLTQKLRRMSEALRKTGLDLNLDLHTGTERKIVITSAKDPAKASEKESKAKKKTEPNQETPESDR